MRVERKETSDVCGSTAVLSRSVLMVGIGCSASYLYCTWRQHGLNPLPRGRPSGGATARAAHSPVGKRVGHNEQEYVGCFTHLLSSSSSSSSGWCSMCQLRPSAGTNSHLLVLRVTLTLKQRVAMVPPGTAAAPLEQRSEQDPPSDTTRPTPRPQPSAPHLVRIVSHLQNLGVVLCWAW